jgi:hypothetical protein
MFNSTYLTDLVLSTTTPFAKETANIFKTGDINWITT